MDDAVRFFGSFVAIGALTTLGGAGCTSAPAEGASTCETPGWDTDCPSDWYCRQGDDRLACYSEAGDRTSVYQQELAPGPRAGVLEVSLELPPRPAGWPEGEDAYAFVQIREGSLPLENGWAREPRDLEGTKLESAETEFRAYVLSSEEKPLRVKVRFCTGPYCVDADSSSCTTSRALWFELEHPFYLGKRTEWHETIDAAPEPTCPGDRATHTVGKCEILGCIEAIPGSGPYCRASDGTHFCE